MDDGECVKVFMAAPGSLFMCISWQLKDPERCEVSGGDSDWHVSQLKYNCADD